MAAVEEVCTKFPPREVDELWSDFSHMVRDHHSSSKINITPAENRAIKELQEDQSGMVLTVDKGVAMVVMDKQDYKE